MKSESKILVRIPAERHKALKDLASRSRRSLNSVCVLALEAVLGPEPPPPGPGLSAISPGSLAESIPLDPILGEFGPDLEGVVLFGSTARGRAGPGSDIDLLLVFRSARPLHRGLYARWDTFAARAGVSRRISPHFCRLPSRSEDAGSLWFEIALEGIVLWERELSISMSLARLRHFMFESRIRRKLSYGVPYWVRDDAKRKAGRGLPQAGRAPAEGS